MTTVSPTIILGEKRRKFMQLIRTSFNLRSDIPWNIIYRNCIRAWIESLKEPRTNKRLYEKLLRKLPDNIDFNATTNDKFEFAGDKLEYNAFTWANAEHIGFTFTTRSGYNGRIWKTQIALKRTNKHVLCFVSQDCDLGRDKNVPKIERPYIIDLLTKLQDGDGTIDIKHQAHILEPHEIDKAKNALTGKLRNILPIVYLSCSEHTHSLKPNILANNLFGIAHVFAEKDASIKDRLAQEFTGKRIPKGGEIGICFANEPITVFNRHDNANWVENPESLVQEIFLKILKANLSLKFNFTWDDFLTAYENYEKDLIEQERINKINTLDEMRKELQMAKKERSDMSVLVETLMAKLEQATKERNQYKEEHANYNSLYQKYENCKAERDTWENLALEADNKHLTAKAELEQAKEKLHKVSSKSNALKQNLDLKKDKDVRYLPILQPKENEMYPNEYICQMIRVLNLALPNVPETKRSPKTRTKQFIEDILDANAEAISIFHDYEQKKRDLEKLAIQEGLQSHNGSKVMQPFNMEIIAKGNHHGKIRFKNDAQERFLGTEASSGSDSARGGKNEASDVTKALLW